MVDYGFLDRIHLENKEGFFFSPYLERIHQGEMRKQKVRAGDGSRSTQETETRRTDQSAGGMREGNEESE